MRSGQYNSKLLTGPKATNFGENISFSKTLLTDAQSVTFVSKPNSLLRVKLTAEAQWPEITTYVSAPSIQFPQHVSNVLGILGVINEMVGDIERIQKYPSMGFQASHELPQNILDAFHFLVEKGFTQHLMSTRAIV